MSEINAISASLTKTSRRLAVASNLCSRACRAAAESRTDYDLAWAEALLTAKGDTVDERRASTTIACKDVMRKARLDEAVRDALKARVRTLESILTATQSKASMLRSEMRLTDRAY